MKRLLFVVTLLCALVVFSVPAFAQECDDEIGCVVIGPDDPIVIAGMFVLSGPNESLGADSLGGAQLALIDRENTLLDRDIVLIEEDEQCNSEGGQATAQRVAADETVIGVIGTSCSSAAVAALPILSEAGMVLISPSNTGPVLTSDDVDNNGAYLPGYYRTAHNDLFQGAIAAQFSFVELGATRVATIHDGSPYADGLQKAMADAFTELGGEVVFQGAVNVGDTDMTAILTEIATTEPDVLYYPIFQPESNFITDQVKSIPGLEDVILMSADGSFSADFPENTGESAIGMYFSGPAVSGEKYEELLVKWDEEIGGVPPSGFHAHSYDATNILLDAIEAVAVEDADGNLVIGRQALRDAITDLEEYDGITGLLTCQDESPFKGDCATGEALAMFQLTEAEVNDDAWPPAAIWDPSMMMMEEEG